MTYQFYDKERRLKSVKNLDKEKYGVQVRTLKEALNHGFILKKVHRILKNNQKTWLKQYIDMNTRLRAVASNDFEK